MTMYTTKTLVKIYTFTFKLSPVDRSFMPSYLITFSVMDYNIRNLDT